MTSPLGVTRRWEAVPAPGQQDEHNSSGRRTQPGSSSFGFWRISASVVLALAICLSMYGMLSPNRPTMSAPLVLPIAIAIGLVIAARAGRNAPSGVDIAAIFATGLGLRFIGMILRYRSPADALVYHAEGKRIGSYFRQFDFSVDPERDVPGTGSLRLFSGALHSLLFNDLFAVFCVVTLLSFAGVVLFHRALCTAVPSADPRRYAILLALWPALWYWPSSLGKESVMILGLGAASLGVAHLLTARMGRGLLLLSLGLVPVVLVRPHVGLMVMAGLATAVVLRRSGPERSRRTAARVALALATLLAGFALAGITAERFDVENLQSGGVSSTLDYTSQQTTQGGSGFEPVRVSTPLHFVPALVTVIFRPFPVEARNFETLASSLEGMVLAVLFLLAVPRLRAAARVAREQAYLIYTSTFIIMFVYAFSAVGNFGILARQRTQLLPFVLCLLAIDVAERAEITVPRRLRRRSLPDQPASGRRRVAEPSLETTQHPVQPNRAGGASRTRVATSPAPGEREG